VLHQRQLTELAARERLSAWEEYGKSRVDRAHEVEVCPRHHSQYLALGRGLKMDDWGQALNRVGATSASA
jgi:hypothetical protein